MILEKSLSFNVIGKDWRKIITPKKLSEAFKIIRYIKEKDYSKFIGEFKEAEWIPYLKDNVDFQSDK